MRPQYGGSSVWRALPGCAAKCRDSLRILKPKRVLRAEAALEAQPVASRRRLQELATCVLFTYTRGVTGPRGLVPSHARAGGREGRAPAPFRVGAAPYSSVEHVIGLVRDERLAADVLRGLAASRRRLPARGVDALDEDGAGQCRASAGPSCCPTTFSSSHGIAPGATNAASVELAMAAAQTRLVSVECCHVARAAPPSIGLGLRKCVATWVSRRRRASPAGRGTASRSRTAPARRRSSGCPRHGRQETGVTGRDLEPGGNGALGKGDRRVREYGKDGCSGMIPDHDGVGGAIGAHPPDLKIAIAAAEPDTAAATRTTARGPAAGTSQS